MKILVIVLLSSLATAQECGDRNLNEAIKDDPTRECRKECETQADCSGDLKQCVCDDLCGLSCFNPDAECPDLTGTLVDGTILIPRGLKYGATAKYRCNDGYYLTGVSQRECRSTRKWSHTAGNCTRGCFPPSNLGNGYVLSSDEGYAPGAVVTYECNTGYTGSGNFDVTCQDDFTWTAATFVCAKLDCGYPGHPDNGAVEGTDYTFAGRIKFTCNAGYTINGRADVYCNADGDWSGPVPECDPVKCPAPDLLPNGDVDETSVVNREFGEEIYFSCRVGYTLVGPTRASCEADGEWGEQPVCKVDVDCTFDKGNTCGYQVTDGDLAPIYEDYAYGNTPSYVLRGAGTLRSASYPIPQGAGTCLKMQYNRDASDVISLQVSSSGGPFATVWTAQKVDAWVEDEHLVSGAENDAESVQWQFVITGEADLDNIRVSNGSNCAMPTLSPQTTPTEPRKEATTNRPTEVTANPAALSTAALPGTKVTQATRAGQGTVRPQSPTTPTDLVTQGGTRARDSTVITVVIVLIIFFLIIAAIVSFLIYKKNMQRRATKVVTSTGSDEGPDGKLVGTNV